ncbi:GtrA family protein [Marinicella gelatinilytica]|uniref:GtrA family protein n=1 Tax=Marinicella gelatinilytica TaxID=2996017 RepID=UPI002260D4C1|nr:GtrA family protein [Marinicella gelatinilytica]MCX7545396.1 GtrA family protein [Marinicella gelatinilytica]
MLTKDTFALLFRYGLVGVLATVVHFSVGYFMHEIIGLTPFNAHALGFVGGLFTAYLGHYHFSFKDTGDHKNRFPKFVVSSLITFCLHQGGVLLLVNYWQLDYSFQALPLLLVTVPLASFLMARFWVFGDR